MEKNKKIDFLKIFIIYFVVLLLFVGVRIASNLGIFGGITNEYALDAVSTTIIQIGILFLVPFVMYLVLFKKKPMQLASDFGYKKLSGKAILICFGIGVLAFIANIFISNFFAIILQNIGYNPQSSGVSGEGYNTFPKFLFGVFFVAVLPALFEEFVHRGLVLRGASKFVGYKKAILISSILFGLMHLNVSQFFYATILGLLMGLLATMTRSIWPAVIVHFCNNFINVFMSYNESAGLTGFSLTGILNAIAKQSTILFFMFVCIVMLLTLMGIFALVKKLFVEVSYKKYAEAFINIEKDIRASGENVTDSEVVHAFENYVFPNIKTPNNIMDVYIDDASSYETVDFVYKVPLICSFVLGALITAFTFIWGVV